MQEEKYKILIIGPQGSGKGTQANMLSEQFHIPYFAMGNLLRQRTMVQDELGKQIADLIDDGNLVPDEITHQIVNQKIHEPQSQNGYILDGFPRRLEQVKMFETIDQFTHAILIKISDQESLRRNMGRRTCQNCQAVYHVEYNPPKKEGICDKCGGKLVIRDDENEEILKKRLATYHEVTKPVENYYRDKGILIEINGEQSMEKVHQDIMEKIQ